MKNESGAETLSPIPSRGGSWLWGVGGFVLIVLSANSVLVYHAVSSHRPLVRDDYYSASLIYDDIREQRLRADTSNFIWDLEKAQEGWQLRLQASEEPLAFQGVLRFYRPSDQSLDREVKIRYMGWNESEGFALYLGETAPLARGAWEIQVSLTDDRGISMEKIFHRFLEEG